MGVGGEGMPDFSLETAAPAAPVCGIDEVGRGPWAGPVLAAAVILNPAKTPEGLDDSKKLSAKKREALAATLRDCAEIGFGEASVAEIEALNLSRATFLAMRRALVALPRAPRFALIDGNRLPPDLGVPAQAVVRGDGRSASIAAASIVAKVARDALMTRLAEDFPGYGWETNAGYGTKAHQEALSRLGVTPHHRRSFRPIHNILYQDSFPNH